MTRNLIAFVFALLGISAAGQTLEFSKIYKPGYNLFVFAPSGLSLRDKPDLKGARIKVVPYRSVVVVQKDDHAPVPVTNSNMEGHWVKVKFEDTTGYLFDGYLSRLYPVRENDEIDDYLGSISKVITTETERPYPTFDLYKKITYENGMTFTTWSDTDRGSFRLLTLQASMFSFQEAYLLASALIPFYFEDDGCPFNASGVFCAKEFASVEIKKDGSNFVILETLAD